MAEIINILTGIPMGIIILFILFLLSMIILCCYNNRSNKRRKHRKDTITTEGYMKLYLQIKHGSGSLDVLQVDDDTPIFSTEVIQKAIFLPPGEHKLTLSGKVKDDSIAANLLPYYTNIKPFERMIFAKKHRVATLSYDVITQDLTLEESEEKDHGTI